MKASFSLIPFATDSVPAIKIMGEIERQQNQLTIEYKLQGQTQVIIPQINTPTRKFGLWEHTCCEFFLGLQDSTQYWEFNLSFAGHWNVYHFLDYRQNLIEAKAFDSLPFQVLQANDNLQLKLKVNLNQIIAREQNLEVGVAAVIEDRARQLSYWALAHSAPEADFHLRDNYLLKF
jgi:hypothetical protein